MSESTAEPLAEVQADATQETAAPTTDDTMERVFNEIEARGEDGDEPAAPVTPPEVQQRGPDGKFVGAEPAAEAPPEPQQQAPTVPDYIAPYAADFAMRGLSPAQAIPVLVDAWRNIERNHEAGLNELAGRYGYKVVPINAPAPAAQTAQEPAPGEWVDPQIAAIKAELEQLKHAETQRQQMTQEQQQAAYRAAYSSVNTEIEEFAKSKAAEGINFDLLRPKMAALIGSGEAADIADAYEQAVYANPTTRAARLAAERAQSEAAAAKATAEKAQAARRAGVINVRADVATPTRGKTTDETMERVYEQIAARS